MPVNPETQNLTGRKPRVRRKKSTPSTPATSSINAIEGGGGVRRSHQAAVAEEVAPAVRKAHRAAKKERKSDKRRGTRRTQSATDMSPAKYAEYLAKVRDEGEPSKTYNYRKTKSGKVKTYKDKPTPEESFFQALTGVNADDLSKTKGEDVALAAATLPAFKAARVGQALVRGSKGLKTAETAARAEKVVAEAKTARKAERAAERGKQATKLRKARATGKQLGKQAAKRLEKTEIKAAAKRTAARRSDRALRAASSPTLAAATVNNTDVSKRVRAFAEGTAKAVVQHPADTASTSARAIIGAPVAAVGDAVDIVTGHPGEVIDSWKKYGKTVAKLASGDAEKVERVTANKVGLIPAASAAGLVVRGGSIARRVSGREKVRVKPVSEHKREADLKRSKKGKTPEKRTAARKRLADNEYRAPGRERRADKRKEAKRTDVAEQTLQGTWTAEMHKGGKGKQRIKRIDAEMGRAGQRRLSDNVTESDIVRLVGAHGLKDERVKAELIALRHKLVDPRREPHPDDKATRQVLDALIERPDSIKNVQGTIDRLEQIQRNSAIRRHSERTGRQETTPDPLDERARLLPVAMEKGAKLPEERMHPALKGKTKIKEGRKLDQRLRSSAKNARRQAKIYRAKAKEAKNPKRAKNLEARAVKAEARAEDIVAVVDRYRRADNMERQSYRDEARGEITAEQGRQVRAEAEVLREEVRADEADRLAEFSGDIRNVLRAEGRREPVYFPQTDVTASAKQVSTKGNKTPQARKEKMLSGSLEREGRVDESGLTLMQEIHRDRAEAVERTRQLSFLEDRALRAFPDDRRFGTEREFDAALREGKLPVDTVFVPVQEFSPAIQRYEPLRREIEHERLRVQATAHQGEQTIGAAVSRSAVDEFRQQSEVLAKEWRVARGAMHAQAIAMLATSPTWLQFQLPATALTILLRHQNPMAHVRALKTAIDAHRKLDPETRVAVKAYSQSNPLDSLSVSDRSAGLDPTTIRAQNRAIGAMMGTPAGRVLSGVWESVKKGGPIMQGIGKYESGLRYYNMLLELDRASGLTLKGTPRVGARVRRFTEGVSHGAVLQHRLLDRLDGMTPPEQLRYLASHDGRRDMEQLADTAYDNVGNWGALSKTEKKLSAVVPFYPFVRMSLHTIFVGYPRNNPIKAAILANLGAQNGAELKHLLGGDPGFFSGWGQTTIHTGGQRHILDLARAAPGGNAVLEAVGGLKEGVGLSDATKLTQPLVGVAVNALAGDDQYGNPLPRGQSQGNAIVEGALNVNPITRKYLAGKVGPDRSEISKLFLAIQRADPTSGIFSNSRWYLADLIDNPKSQQEAVRLSNLLDKAFAAEELPSASQVPVRGPEHKAYLKTKRESDAAWDEINGMLRAYGIETQKEQDSDAKKAGKRMSVNQYGAKPSSSSSSSSTSTDSPGWLGGGSSNSTSSTATDDTPGWLK